MAVSKFAALFVCVFVMSARAAAPVIEPDDEWLLMAHYKMRAESPPFALWAQQSASRISNAFDRAAFEKEKAGALRGAFGGIDVGLPVVMTMFAQLSDYDPQFAEFQLVDLGDGISIVPATRERRPFGVPLAVKMANGGLAQIWPVDAARAEMLLRGLGAVRSVRLRMTLKLSKAEAPALSGQRVLWVKIMSYDILKGAAGNEVIGSVRVPDK